jgi:surface polysaccharide O-acyltransferase-like enzyme
MPQATTRIGALWVLCVGVHERKRTIHHKPWQGIISNSHLCIYVIKDAKLLSSVNI